MHLRTNHKWLRSRIKERQYHIQSCHNFAWVGRYLQRKQIWLYSLPGVSRLEHASNIKNSLLIIQEEVRKERKNSNQEEIKDTREKLTGWSFTFPYLWFSKKGAQFL